MANTLTRWEPFAELADIRSRFDRMLADLSDGGGRDWTPAIDVIRDNGHLVVRADVPGIKPDEITIEVTDDALTLSGRHAETKQEKEAGFVRRERRYGAFLRTLPLPEGVDAQKIKATTRDGVLEVKVPLPKAVAKEPVKITPSTGS
jgi:HSP20 family protein